MNDPRHKDMMQHQLASWITFNHFLRPTPISLMPVARIPMQRSKSVAQLIQEARRYEAELKSAWEANNRAQKKSRGIELEVTGTSVVNQAPPPAAKKVVKESTVASKRSKSADPQAQTKQLAPAEVVSDVPENVPPVCIPEKTPTTGRRPRSAHPVLTGSRSAVSFTARSTGRSRPKSASVRGYQTMEQLTSRVRFNFILFLKVKR